MSGKGELNEAKIFSHIAIRILRSSDKVFYLNLHELLIRAEVHRGNLVGYLTLSCIEEELELGHIALGIFSICNCQLSIAIGIYPLVSLSVLPWDKLTIIQCVGCNRDLKVLRD